MKLKYLLMIFDLNNNLLGFNSYLFNTKQQGLKYLKLINKKDKKIILQPIDVLNTKDVYNRTKQFSKIIAR